MLQTIRVFVALGAALCAVQAVRPNILFVLVDDLGWNDLSFHGSSQIPTPHIDSIAQSGQALDRFYVAPVCSPTRSTLYSGRVTTSTGIFDPFLIPNNGSLNLQCNQICTDCGPCMLLPQVLKTLGYKTQLFGKWHVGQSNWDLTPRARGFDGYAGYLLGEQDHFTHVRAEGFDFWNDTTVDYDVYGKYATYIYGPAAKAFISDQGVLAKAASARGVTPEPWFMGIMTQTQHAPVQSPSECWGRFNKTIPQGNRQIQAGMVSCLDDAIGGILRTLNESGQLDSTTIILHTDNGGIASSSGSNMPLRGQKHTLYEGGVRGIAAISGAGIDKHSAQNSELLHVSDWYFSLASFAARGIADSEVSHPDSQGVLHWLHEAQLKAHGVSGTPQRLLRHNGDASASAAIKALRSAPPFTKWDGMDAWEAFSGAAPSPRDWILHAALPTGSGADGHTDVDAGAMYRGIPSDSAGLTGPLQGREGEMPRRSFTAPKGLLGAIAMMQDGSLFKLIAGDFQTDNSKWFSVPGQNFSEPFTVQCSEPPKDNAGCEPAKQPCLFNITHDPCEHTNVYSAQPTIAGVLEARLADAMTTAHKPVVGEPVPLSCQPNAANNFTWIPCTGTPPTN